VLTLIREAESYILVDMFLWNSFQGATPETYRLLSSELTEALIAKKVANPEVTITVVSDPLNTVYDGQRASHFDALEAAGIPVVLTKLSELRDSNPTYSAFWRAFLQWPDLAHTALLDKPYTARFMPNVLDTGGESVTIRAYLKLFNFKANHRKLLVADSAGAGGRTLVSLVTSANPHDGSSRHSNVALRVEGGVWRDLVESEQAVADFSGGVVPEVAASEQFTETEGAVGVRLLTEYAIEEAVVAALKSAGVNDTVELGMFYLSEGSIINALIAASNRGALVRVILDPNKDAFGREKNGVPNRPVAAKLVRETEGKLEVRWCATFGEQCHSKFLLVGTAEGYTLTLGSANFTRRNLNNLNLDTNLQVSSKAPSQAYTDAKEYFNRLWANQDGRLSTHDYTYYADDSRSKRIQSWIMENTGLSTF
jgi:HKD family nuclease